MSKVINAWAAGVFSGEGSVITNRHYDGSPSYWKLPVIQVTQSEQRIVILEKLNSHYGGSIRPTGNPYTYHWQLHKADEAVSFLRGINQYCDAKGNLIEAALMAYQTKSVEGPLSKEMIKLRKICMKRIRNINKNRSDR